MVVEKGFGAFKNNIVILIIIVKNIALYNISLHTRSIRGMWQCDIIEQHVISKPYFMTNR